MVFRIFTDHPASAGQSYPEHLGFAVRVGAMLLWAGLAAVIHGILPFLFQTTASRIILALNAEITAKTKAPGQG